MKAALEQWLKEAGKAIEVSPTEKTVKGEEEKYGVWVTNGEGGMNWGGRAVAWCSNDLDAQLIAEALRRMRDGDDS